MIFNSGVENNAPIHRSILVHTFAHLYFREKTLDKANPRLEKDNRNIRENDFVKFTSTRQSSLE